MGTSSEKGGQNTPEGRMPAQQSIHSAFLWFLSFFSAPLSARGQGYWASQIPGSGDNGRAARLLSASTIAATITLPIVGGGFSQAITVLFFPPSLPNRAPFMSCFFFFFLLLLFCCCCEHCRSGLVHSGSHGVLVAGTCWLIVDCDTAMVGVTGNGSSTADCVCF